MAHSVGQLIAKVVDNSNLKLEVKLAVKFDILEGPPSNITIKGAGIQETEF
jgi:hypothetical protein